MKVVVAGSRNITDPAVVRKAIADSGFIITEIVSGGARGVDSLAEQFALANNLKLSVFPAEWNKYGRQAGPIRNQKMADYADALIAVWDGKSRGTWLMIKFANKRNLKVQISTP